MTSCYHGHIEYNGLKDTICFLQLLNFQGSISFWPPRLPNEVDEQQVVLSPELWNHRLPTALLTTSQLTAEAVKRR